MPAAGPERIAALLQTALHDRSGESVEGAFVDHWESYAYLADRALDAIFRQHGFSAQSAEQVRQALRDPRAPADLRRAIQRQIDRLETQPLSHALFRACKETHNALPIFSSPPWTWALRPDGTLLCIDHEAVGFAATLEGDPRIRFAALAKSSLGSARSERNAEQAQPWCDAIGR